MKPTIILAVALALASSCSDSGTDQASAPSPDRATVDACRAYNDAVKLLAKAIRESPAASAAVSATGDMARPKVDAAADLASGPAQQDMKRVAAAIGLFHAKAEESLQPGYDHTVELTALKNAMGAVATDCQRAGVQVERTS